MDVNDDNVAESDMVIIKLFIVAFIICRIYPSPPQYPPLLEMSSDLIYIYLRTSEKMQKIAKRRALVSIY